MVPLAARRSRRHLVWLLSFALLLPIAQTYATRHALSLACADQGDRQGKPLNHPSHCDICLTAAGLHSGAASGVPVSSANPAGLHEAPRFISIPFASAVPASGYRSRAPPFALS